MAISKIKPRHASEGRSIAAILKDRIDYDKNPEKTKGGLLVSSYQCGADTAWREFTVSKQIYEAETGRGRAPKDDVISYLIIQSFKPGEITPEEANELGYQLALEFTGGQHQFIVATHTDRHHIHCHIEFNSTTLDCTHMPRTMSTISLFSASSFFCSSSLSRACCSLILALTLSISAWIFMLFAVAINDLQSW